MVKHYTYMQYHVTARHRI